MSDRRNPMIKNGRSLNLVAVVPSAAAGSEFPTYGVKACSYGNFDPFYFEQLLQLVLTEHP